MILGIFDGRPYTGVMNLSTGVTLPALLVSLLLILAAAPAGAQEPAPDSSQAQELYQSALLLEAEGEHELADALFDYILRRYPESAVAARIRAARAMPGARRDDGDGRTELVVWSTLYGLWLGVAVPAMFSADGTEPYGLGLLAGGPAGFVVGRSATRNGSITEGEAGAITWGGGWGTWQGFGWAQVFDLGSGCEDPGDIYCDPDEPSSEAMFGSMVAGGLLGTGAGILATRRYDISAGDATLLNLGSVWGTWYGFAAAVLASTEEDDSMLAATLMGGNLGAAAGALLGARVPVTRSQARTASIIGVVGGLAGAGIDLLVQPESEKVAIAIPAVMSALALALGASYVGLGSGSDGEREAAAQSRFDWTPGGPVLPVAIRGPAGEYRTGLEVTLLSGSF